MVNSSTSVSQIELELKKDVLHFSVGLETSPYGFRHGQCIRVTREDNGELTLNITNAPHEYIPAGLLSDITGPSISKGALKLNQTAIHFDGNLCGTLLSIPKVFLVYQQADIETQSLLTIG